MSNSVRFVLIVLLALVAFGTYLEFPRPLEGYVERVENPAHIVLTVHRHGRAGTSETLDLWSPEVGEMLEGKTYFEKLRLAEYIDHHFSKTEAQASWVPLWGYRTPDGHKGGTVKELVVNGEHYKDVVRRIITNSEPVDL